MVFLQLADDVIVNADSIASIIKLQPLNGEPLTLRVVLKNRGFTPHPTQPKQVLLVNAQYEVTAAYAERLWTFVQNKWPSNAQSSS